MKTVSQYPNGVFNWVDLATPDVAGAKAFYGGLFGWEADDRPTDMGTDYTMFHIDGNTVAGAGPLPPDMQGKGIPAYWTSYVKHDDVDSVAEKATAAGGNVIFPPMDVMEEGRMTMISDPEGVVIGVWQPKDHIGAALVNTNNTLVWNELQTRNGDQAKAFYEAVFDWTTSYDQSGYGMYAADGRIQAGMMQMDDSWPAEVPANWSVYFMVEDVDTAVAKVQELGGSVMMPPQAAGEMGRFAVVSDPQGGVFTVMKFSGPVDPPPGHSAD